MAYDINQKTKNRLTYLSARLHDRIGPNFLVELIDFTALYAVRKTFKT